MTGLRRALLVVVLLAAAGAAAGLVVLHGVRSLDEPLKVSAPLRFKVAPGSRFSRVAAELGAQGIVEHPRSWVLYARWKGVASAIKTGEYEIDPGATPRSLLEKLVAGQVVLHSFTIVDGWRAEDMLAALRRDPDISVTAGDSAQDVMSKLGAPGLDPEGQFLPETYRFPEGTPELEILRQAHVALVRELESAWATRDPALMLKNAAELLTVASIVQKESGVPQELPKIAGLYLHRLRIGMRLQADPTVIYGLGEHYDGQLHSVDLHTDGAYNTYMRAGLPPTPIALAGAAAIRAAAHPENTDALYFVASPKDDGSHIFSATLEEQNAAVARYVAHLREKAAETGK
jgi:UPF0755 protein